MIRRSTVALLVVALVVTAGCSAFGDIGNQSTPCGASSGASATANGPQFEEVAAERGLDYRTTGSEVGSADGAILVGDYDDDGAPDLLAIGGDRPVLFENVDGAFQRTDVLPPLGDASIKSGLFFDRDNDGLDDLLLVPRSGEPVFLANTGDGFERREVGLDVKLGGGVGATVGDYDGDGRPDLFLVHNGNWSDRIPHRNANGDAVDGNPNYLFRGTESGFERVEDAGIRGERWSLAASFVDLNGDGHQDVHVANDYGYDVVYTNRGDGTFDHRTVPGSNRHGMASEVADVDGDGSPDVFVTNIEFRDQDRIWELQSGLAVSNRGNQLFLAREDGTLDDVAGERGVRRGGWGWAAELADLNNDGRLDLIHATKTYLWKERSGDWVGVSPPPSLWMRAENGTYRRQNATAAGFEGSNGRGLATLDFDRDGDQDVVIADTSGAFKLYENGNDCGDWLQVRVSNREGGTALGAEVYVETEDGSRRQVQRSESDFFSQSSRWLHFGLGPDATVERVRVVYPDGTERTFDQVGTNRRVLVRADGSLEYVGNRSDG